MRALSVLLFLLSCLVESAAVERVPEKGGKCGKGEREFKLPRRDHHHQRRHQRKHSSHHKRLDPVHPLRPRPPGDGPRDGPWVPLPQPGPWEPRDPWVPQPGPPQPGPWLPPPTTPDPPPLNPPQPWPVQQGDGLGGNGQADWGNPGGPGPELPTPTITDGEEKVTGESTNDGPASPLPHLFFIVGIVVVVVAVLLFV